ncbi:MAG TPA: single-stranded-DNA-specific exonuclease RecJ, partial [Chitinophagaceae bacterium]|nr:single-stranded-DNA-specific exonuclease RecJ [Chitinophagaceae bacterium]
MPIAKRWILPATDIDAAESLRTQLGIHPVLCRLLVQRGITTYEEAKNFFRPSLDHLHDPFLIKDMNLAVDRIIQAFNNAEKILIYGDYDVDGTTAVSLVCTFMSDIYPDTECYIPDRYKEGYGISTAGIDYAAQNGFGLIIALDCGIKSLDKIAYANEKGIDFIICDHHLPGDAVPDAVAVLDPKQSDCPYPYKELSGCGIGFKLMQALAIRMQIDSAKVYDLLDLVAVSIASDIVPITGENRVLAYFGLKKINNNPRPGLKALMSIAGLFTEGGIARKNIDITDLVFVVGPRVNAAGRMQHGSNAVDMLTENDEAEAFMKAEVLQKNNTDRVDVDRSITDEALQIMATDSRYAGRKCTVLFNKSWHKGVIGIVASRLIEKFYRPTIILTESNGYAVGSARSIADFDLYEAIDQCSEHLVQFGGHKYAAGLTIELDKVDGFIAKFEEIVSSKVTEEMMIPQINIDAEVELSDVNEKFLNIVNQMAPFGPGNMKPVFLTKNVRNGGGCRVVKEQHLRIEVSKNGQGSRKGIGFGLSYLYEAVQKPSFDICYQMELNEWNGQREIQIQVK